MLTYLEAKKHHPAVRESADRYSESVASELWSAIAWMSPARGGSYAEAVLDTMGAETAQLVTSEPTAAAVALKIHAKDACGLDTQRCKSFELRDRAREGWEAFERKAAAAKDMANGFGWDLSDAWQVYAETNVYDLDSVRRIAELAGRMFAALKGELATRVQGVPEEVHSIELGNAIPRLLPLELAQLADSDLELPVLGRIVEKRALQYAVRGSSASARGPLVLAIDESGSMHQGRREWAKSAALAVARVAHADKRAVTVVHFSTATRVAALDPSKPADVLAMIRSHLGGGTAIGYALDVAATEIASGPKGADVIVITDGIDGNDFAIETAIAKIHALPARLWTVGIQCEIPAESPLRSKAAGYEPVTSLDIGAAKAVFAGATS